MLVVVFIYCTVNIVVKVTDSTLNIKERILLQTKFTVDCTCYLFVTCTS